MKKAFDIIKSVLVWAIMIAAVGMMIFTIFSVTTLDQNSRSVFGYRFFIVQSNSMSATDFDAGDIIFVKEVDPTTLQAGDIIAYVSQNEHNYNDIVTHKIRELTTNENGDPGFITYGTTTGSDDETIVTYAYVLGKYIGKLPKLGKFFAFLKTTPGYILCILVPFLLLIGYNGVNCIILFRKYKKEQMGELQAERDGIEEMKKELEALRSQLTLNESSQVDRAALNPPPPTPAVKENPYFQLNDSDDDFYI